MATDAVPLRDLNRAALERIGRTSLFKVDLTGAGGHPILLLTAITLANSPTSLAVASAHQTREQALGSIADDGVNVLPSLIVDLDGSPFPITLIEYDRVHGMDATTNYPLPLGDQREADEFAEQLHQALGLDDD